MKKSRLILLLIICLKGFTCDEHGITGFLPKNDYHLSINSFLSNDMTQERFNQIIDKINDVYSPIVLKHSQGKPLEILKFWSNSEVNAYAKRESDRWVVAMFGGLARHPLVTEDGFAAVVCHEIGHHIGGAPKKLYVSKWSSSEGQADYWATLKCLRKVFENDDNIKIMSQVKIDPTAVKVCDDQYADASEQALCYRLSMAGVSLGHTLAELSRGKEVDLSKPDPSEVKSNYEHHPKAQCRLDTYFAGATCTHDANVDVSQDDPNIGTCSRGEGQTVGVRPRCWYFPSED